MVPVSTFYNCIYTSTIADSHAWPCNPSTGLYILAERLMECTSTWYSGLSSICVLGCGPSLQKETLAPSTSDHPLTQGLIERESARYRSQKAERGQASSTPKAAETGTAVKECRLSLGLVPLTIVIRIYGATVLRVNMVRCLIHTHLCMSDQHNSIPRTCRAQDRR